MHVTESTPPVIYFKSPVSHIRSGGGVSQCLCVMCIVYVDYHKAICQLATAINMKSSNDSDFTLNDWRRRLGGGGAGHYYLQQFPSYSNRKCKKSPFSRTTAHIFPLETPLRLSPNMFHGWRDNSMLAKRLVASTYLSSIVSDLYDA